MDIISCQFPTKICNGEPVNSVLHVAGKPYKTSPYHISDFLLHQSSFCFLCSSQYYPFEFSQEEQYHPSNHRAYVCLCKMYIIHKLISSLNKYNIFQKNWWVQKFLINNYESLVHDQINFYVNAHSASSWCWFRDLCLIYKYNYPNYSVIKAC